MSSTTPNFGFYKKDPATDGNSTFDVVSMLNNNWDTIDVKVPVKSTADTTYYVSPTGNDSNAGTSAGTAFKTIAKAISMIPQVNNHKYIINLADGTYNEDVDFNGIVGQGYQYLIGNNTSPGNVLVRSLKVHQTTGYVEISGMMVTGFNATTGNSIIVDRARNVQFTKVNSTFTDHSRVGFLVLNSNAALSACTISNKNVAVRASNNGFVYSIDCTGSGNDTGYEGISGGHISYVGTVPGATTQFSMAYSGIVKTAFAGATGGNITLYVSTTGSDSNDGLTSGTALRNIQTAINRIPQIVNHDATIYVADGVYSESISLNGFVGKGNFNLTGNVSNPDNVSINNLVVNNCILGLSIIGLKATSTGAQAFQINRSIGIYINGCKAIGSAPANHGCLVVYSIAQIANCMFSNHSSGIYADAGSSVLSNTNAGTGNSIGLVATGAATIGAAGAQPSGTTAISQVNGGAVR